MGTLNTNMQYSMVNTSFIRYIQISQNFRFNKLKTRNLKDGRKFVIFGDI